MSTLLSFLTFIFSTLFILILVVTAIGIVASIYQAVYEFFFCETRTVLIPTGIPMDNLVEEHVFEKRTGKLVRRIPVDNSLYQ